MTKGVNCTEMAQFLDRIERLEEEKKAIADDVKGVWKEAKERGYDMKAMRRAHSIRKLDREDRLMLGTYTQALGLFDE